MQPSSLQLRRVEFLSISVTPREEPDIFSPEQSFEPFLFQGTRVLTSISHALADENEASKHTDFLINFGFSLPGEGNNPPPYLVDIRCVGFFTIAKAAFPDPVARLDAGVVNGVSMLYGIVREMVTNITSRSWYGPMLLPSVNFQDQRPSLSSKENGPEVVKTARKSASKSAPKKAIRSRKKTTE